MLSNMMGHIDNFRITKGVSVFHTYSREWEPCPLFIFYPKLSVDGSFVWGRNVHRRFVGKEPSFFLHRTVNKYEYASSKEIFKLKLKEGHNG